MQQPTVSNLAVATSTAFASPATGQSVLSLRLTQDYAGTAFGKLVHAVVSVSKPPKSAFFRTRGNAEFSTILNLLDASKLGGDGMYAVGPDVAPLIADQTRLTQLRLAVTSQGVPYLVPTPLTSPDGRQNPWHLSLARAMEMAETRWIRVSANMARGGYDVFEARGQLPDPQWPAESFEELLEVGFRDRLILSEDHALVQQLLGV